MDFVIQRLEDILAATCHTELDYMDKQAIIQAIEILKHVKEEDK